jgi:hypothetical protein
VNKIRKLSWTSFPADGSWRSRIHLPDYAGSGDLVTVERAALPGIIENPA